MFLECHIKRVQHQNSCMVDPRPLLARPLLVGPLLVRPLLVGPLLVGPLLVGPLLNGPLLVGPLLVGPLLVGPLLVGPLLVGPLLVGPLLVGTLFTYTQDHFCCSLRDKFGVIVSLLPFVIQRAFQRFKPRVSMINMNKVIAKTVSTNQNQVICLYWFP